MFRPPTFPNPAVPAVVLGRGDFLTGVDLLFCLLPISFFLSIVSIV
jgi:hypothetical protein